MDQPPEWGEQLRELLTFDSTALARLCEHQHPHALAEIIEPLADNDLWQFLARISHPHAASVFSHLPLERQARLIDEHDPQQAAALVEDMAADDRVDLVKALHPRGRLLLLQALSDPVRRDIEGLAIYGEGTAGAVMSTDVATLLADETVAEALQRLRGMADRKETIYYNYIVDPRGKLLGIVSLRDLVLASPTTKLAELMNSHVIYARVDDDQAEVAEKIREYDLLALPIVHGDCRLVGVVTVDDALDVNDEEVTEDFHRMASVGAITTGLREAGVWLLYRKRIGWLMVLIFFNIFSGAGIAFFENTIAAYVALVFFLPLLIDSGGNAGSQSATLMIRALATGDVRRRDWLQLLGKEAVVALVIGATMAAAVSLIGIVRAPEVVVVVALTMVVVVFVGSLIGMLLPFVFTRLGLDPATASAPLITSMTDIAGVLIYFSIATWYLGIGQS